MSRSKLTAEQWAEVANLLREDRLTYGQIALRYGVSAVLIYKYRRRAGIVRSARSGKPKGYPADISSVRARPKSDDGDLIHGVSDCAYYGPVPHRELPEPNVIAGITKAQLMSGRARPARRIIAAAQ